MSDYVRFAAMADAEADRLAGCKWVEGSMHEGAAIQALRGFAKQLLAAAPPVEPCREEEAFQSGVMAGQHDTHGDWLAALDKAGLSPNTCRQVADIVLPTEWPIAGVPEANEYRPWEAEGITEAEYWRRRYLEVRGESTEERLFADLDVLAKGWIYSDAIDSYLRGMMEIRLSRDFNTVIEGEQVYVAVVRITAPEADDE